MAKQSIARTADRLAVGAYEPRRVTFTNAMWLAAGFIAVIALALALWAARTAVLLLFAGILLAILLNAITRTLARLSGLPRLAILPVVVAAIAVFLLGLFWRAGPLLVEQIQQLGVSLGQSLATIGQEARLEAAQRGLLKDFDWTMLFAQLPSPLGIATGATAVAGAVFGAVTGFMIIIFFGVYFAIDPDTYVRLAVRPVPVERRNEAQGILLESGAVLERWLLGQVLTMTVIGTITYFGLLLLGVPLALVLALFAALAGFIPYIGPIIGAVPMLLIAAGQSFTLMLWVLGLYATVQLLESYVLTPLIQARAVFLPPAVVVASQLVLGALFGILGLAFATPLAAAASVPLRHYLAR